MDTNSIPIFAQLVRIAETHPDLLVAYKNDLYVHDKRTLEESREVDRWIWGIRECGTSLFPLDRSHDSVWLTYYTDGEGRETNTRFYLLTFTGKDVGEVEEITPISAKRLAKLHGKGYRLSASLG